MAVGELRMVSMPTVISMYNTEQRPRYSTSVPAASKSSGLMVVCCEHTDKLPQDMIDFNTVQYTIDRKEQSNVTLAKKS